MSKKKSLGRTVKKLENQVSKMSKKVDVKRSDLLSAANAVSSTPSYILLNGLAQGDDSTNRDGNEVFISSLYIKGEITAADSSNLLRMLIIWDSQANSAAPTDAQLFYSPTAYPQLSMINYDYRKRFRVLSDEMFVVDSDDPVTFFRRYIKIGRKTQYVGSSSLIAGITKGALYCVLVSDSGAASHPLVTFQSRIHFTS